MIEELYQQHRASLVRWFKGKAPEAAEDLTSEVFLRVLRRRLHEKYTGHAWLYRMAYWVLAEYRRSQAPAPVPLEEWDHPTQVDTPEVEERVTLEQVVRRMMGMLPSPQREALALTAAGASAEDIARQLGLNRKQAFNRRTQARHTLRRAYADLT